MTDQTAVDYRTSPPSIEPVATAWQAWWEDHDMWDGDMLYADLDTAKRHSAVAYVGEEYSWLPGDDPDDEAPETSLTWELKYGRWRLLDKGQDTGVRLAETRTYATPAGQAPDTDQAGPSRRAGLRDRIRRAICEAEGFMWDSDMLEPDEYGDHADTVLAVLYREWPWLRAEAEDDEELTAQEARDLADELGTELYRAQDALAFVEECCVISDREQQPVTTADVREWLKGARCGRQLVADGRAPELPPLDQDPVARRLGLLPTPTDRAAVYRQIADQQTQLAVADDLARRRDMAAARRQLVKELRRLAATPAAVSAVPGQTDGEAPSVCEGFVWIGQAFTTCDRCARPAWEHAGEEVPVEGAGPFDNRRTVRPWKPGQADIIRARWAPEQSAAGAQQPKEA